MSKLAVLIVFIAVFVCAQAQIVLPDGITLDSAILDFAQRFKIDLGNKLKSLIDSQIAKLKELLSNLNPLNALSKLKSLKESVGAEWTQKVLDDAESVVQKVATGVSIIKNKEQILSNIIQNAGDVKSAVLLECETVRGNLTSIIRAGKANLKEKAQAFLNIRSILDDVKPLELISVQNKIANLRSLIDLTDFLALAIGKFEAELNESSSKCDVIAEKAAAIAALNLAPKFEEIKAALKEKISNRLDKAESRIQQLMEAILKAKLKAGTLVKVTVDDVKKTVELTIDGVYTKASESIDDIKAIIQRVVKTALKAVLLNVDVKIVVDVKPPAKRQASLDVSFSVKVTTAASAFDVVVNLKSLVPQLPLATAVANYAKDFAENLKTAANEIEAVKAQIAQTTAQKIRDGITAITKEISEVNLDEAKKALENQVDTLKSKITDAKAAVDAAVDATTENVKQLLEVKKAQIETQVADLKSKVEEFKLKLPSAKVVVENIKESIANATEELKKAVDSAKPAIQAKIDALYEDLKKAMAEVATVTANLANLQKALADALIAFEKQKVEIAAQVAKTVAGKFTSTAAEIQTFIVGKEEEVTAQLKDLATLVNASIQDLKAKWEKLPVGFKGSIDVSFDAGLSEAKVKALLSMVLQTKFGAKLDVSPAKKTAKRADTTTSTFDVSISSTDGSTADVKATNNNDATSPSSSLPLGAIIGIAVGAVVLVVAVVVVILLVKKGQDSKRGQLL